MNADLRVDAILCLLAAVAQRAVRDQVSGARRLTGKELSRIFAGRYLPGDVRHGDARQLARVYSAAWWLSEIHS